MPLSSSTSTSSLSSSPAPKPGRASNRRASAIATVAAGQHDPGVLLPFQPAGPLQSLISAPSTDVSGRQKAAGEETRVEVQRKVRKAKRRKAERSEKELGSKATKKKKQKKVRNGEKKERKSKKKRKRVTDLQESPDSEVDSNSSCDVDLTSIEDCSDREDMSQSRTTPTELAQQTGAIFRHSNSDVGSRKAEKGPTKGCGEPSEQRRKRKDAKKIKSEKRTRESKTDQLSSSARRTNAQKTKSEAPETPVKDHQIDKKRAVLSPTDSEKENVSGSEAST